MRLLLIRHAQTHSNVLGLLDTRVPGPNITELGRQQAAAIPRASWGGILTSITVSHMARTMQTAQPLAEARGLVPAVEPGVAEISAGELEMAFGSEPIAIYTKAAWAWAAGTLDQRLADGEDGHEFFARFDDVVERIMARDEELPAIVSHGASIRVWVGNRCVNVSDSFAADSELHNTGTALVERDARGRWELVEWNAMPVGGPELHGVSGPAEGAPTGSMTRDDPIDAPRCESRVESREM